MRPTARYYFTQNPEARTRYVLQDCTGADVLPLPVYKKGDKQGKRYVQFEKRREFRPGRRRFEYAFSLEKDKRGSSKCLTGVNFSVEYSGRTFGDDKNIGRADGLLIEFSENREDLTIWVFDGQADTAETLFDRWTAGGLCMAVDPLPLEKGNPPTA